MADSFRPPQPGDSSLDFNDLEESEDATLWMPPRSDSAAEGRPVNDPDRPSDASQRDEPESPASEPDRLSDTIVGLPSFQPPDDELVDGPTMTSASTRAAPSGDVSGGETAAAASAEAMTAAPSPFDGSERLATPSSTSTPRHSEVAFAIAPRQRLLLILLASYASAVTLALLWLLVSRSNPAPHELEHLPDVAPLNSNEFRYVPESASLPPGHTLPLGGAQQLGHIRVQPLRVTRGPVEFTHYANASLTKPPTEPVLKLWLRFTNVSEDQLIAPLDATLLFKRKYDGFGETDIANQLVFAAGQRESGGRRAFVLDHPETSEWDLKGQWLGRRLKPGESIETYIPTNPGDDDDLTGDLLWRVHLRKGFHPQTGHGVTTLIEVPFSSSDVQNEPETS